ncbi:MAG: GNAT family N-acetyltransferase [Rubrivivax sp.]
MDSHLNDGSERLIIEPLSPGHAGELFAALDDPRVHRWVDSPAPVSVEALAANIGRMQRGPADAGERWLNWALRRRDLGSCIGTLQATVEAEGLAWIAYVLGAASWRQGFATEAVRWLIDELRSHHGVTRLRASVDQRNGASVRVLERTAFVNLGPRAADLRGEPSIDLHFERQS